jgi:HlyD family secretion protein
MRNSLVFLASAAGLAIAVVSAAIFAETPKTPPPLFAPAANPYAKGIYAEGIIESDQGQGENINLYPEVPGPITGIFVAEGQTVHRGDPLISIDDSVQRATAQQNRAQADAAGTLLAELRAQPRPETLEVAAAQVENAKATLKSAQDERAKQEHAYAIDPHSVSLDALDNARNAERIAATNLVVVEKQYALTKAGAWSYDIDSQERQFAALSRAADSAEALLAKYTVRAPGDGVVLSVAAAVGSYVSSQGAFDEYTQAMAPLVVMGTPQEHLAVRAYIDEILVHRLPEPDRIVAQMSIRGTDVKVPLTFTRIQPYVSPKIELSDERQERVDVRVLPVIFRFEKARTLNVYPGQLVDIFIGEKSSGGTPQALNAGQR